MEEKIAYKEIISSVKEAYDISDYIRGTGAELKNAGVGKWKMRCPFHNEKTPSCVVNDSFQNYHCFGCGANGDIISYVMNTENYTFADALKKLGEDKGINVELGDAASVIDYKSLYKILKFSALYYCQKFNKLHDTHAAKQEIIDRGLTFDNNKQNFVKYGFAPAGNQLYKMLSSKGFSDDLIVESGVCNRNDETGEVYDFFRSRLMFVFTDRNGRPIGFSSRKIFEEDKRGKYVNSSDNALFHKTKALYNHSLARQTAGKENTLYICEGQFDVSAFVEAGLNNVVASSGTAFSKDHISECNKMVGSQGKLIFCFDGDKAGVNAAIKVFTTLPSVHENSYVVLFPEGQDPCDYRKQNGNEKFKEYLNNAKPMVEFVIEQLKNNYDFDSMVGKSEYMKECARVAKTISNAFIRDKAIKLIALETFSTIDVVKDLVSDAKPYTVNEVVNVDHTNDPNLQEYEESKNDEQSQLTIEKIEQYYEENTYFNVSVKFISLGLSNKRWRQSVLNSINLLPKNLKPFVLELEKTSDKDVIFPEMFDHQDIAEYFMNNDFSPFYGQMSREELKNHFIYLHDFLVKQTERIKTTRKVEGLKKMLASDESESLEFFKEVLTKNNIQ